MTTFIGILPFVAALVVDEALLRFWAWHKASFTTAEDPVSIACDDVVDAVQQPRR